MMAPLDQQRRAEVLELIRQDARAIDAQTAAMAEIAKSKSETERIQLDTRTTTERFALAQAEPNTEQKRTVRQLTQDIETKFIEFASVSARSLTPSKPTSLRSAR